MVLISGKFFGNSTPSSFPGGSSILSPTGPNLFQVSGGSLAGLQLAEGDYDQDFDSWKSPLWWYIVFVAVVLCSDPLLV